MQQSSRRKMKLLLKESIDETIIHYSLQGLLSTEQTFALNKELGILSLLGWTETRACLIMQQQFSISEICMLIPLLESYPYYCPYEVLLANFSYGKTTEKLIERCRIRLQEASEEGIWDVEMKPIRNVLSRTRIKLRRFQIEISSILETGYLLTSIKKSFNRYDSI